MNHSIRHVVSSRKALRLHFPPCGFGEKPPRLDYALERAIVATDTEYGLQNVERHTRPINGKK